MHLNHVDSQKLFGKSVTVTIKDCFTNQFRTNKLFLSIEWQETSSGIYRKELLVSLTDNNDPFFLFNLHLSEEDFQILKTSQGLLVDFSSFPQKFIELIELCLQEESKAQPKFVLTFNVNEKLCSSTSSSQFDIIETNPFKHLTHLSLTFVTATESSVKQYLVTCFKNLKEEKHQLQNRLTYLEKEFKEKLSSCQETLNIKVQELDSVRKELSVELSVKESQHARELQEEKEKYLYKQKEEEIRIDKERKEKEHALRKQIQQLESRVTCLDTLNKELQDKNYKNDATIRDLRSQVLSFEDETKRINERLRSYKHQNEHLESEVRHMAHLKDKINELEQEISNKKLTIKNLQDEIETQLKQKKALESEIDKLNTQIQINEKSASSLKEDIGKGNAIIMKLQEEVKYQKEKIKAMNRNAAKHENYIIEKEEVVQNLRKKLSEQSELLESESKKVVSLSETTSSLKEKLMSVEKELKTRNNVIKWLNRQLTDRCVVPQYTPPSNFVPSPISTAQVLSETSPVAPNSNLSPSACGSEKVPPSKVPLRNKNLSPSLQQKNNSPLLIQTPVSTADSAYETSPSCNAYRTNTSSGNMISVPNANDMYLDLDPSALSAAFGSDHILKHSTAKKQNKFQTTSKTKK